MIFILEARLDFQARGRDWRLGSLYLVICPELYSFVVNSEAVYHLTNLVHLYAKSTSVSRNCNSLQFGLFQLLGFQDNATFACKRCGASLTSSKVQNRVNSNFDFESRLNFSSKTSTDKR